jgi:hypothetical protein
VVMQGYICHSNSSRTSSEMIRIISWVTTLSVTLWVGGFGCLMCCQPPTTTGSRHLGTSVESSTWSDGYSRAADQSMAIGWLKAATTNSLVDQTCCSDTGHALEHRLLPRAIVIPALDTTISISHSLTSAAGPIQESTPSNRGSTYLLCCRLLI